MHPHHQSPLDVHERLLRHDPTHLGDLVAPRAEHPAVTPQFIAQLAAPLQGVAASIYLPTHRGGPDARQDHIRLKNLLSDVERQAPELSPVVDAMRRRSEEAEFWAHPMDGLAWFADATGSRHCWTPTTMPELAICSRHRHLKPLVPLLMGDGPFHLLELHQHGVRLHAGTRFGMHEVPLPDIPTRVEELLHAGQEQRDVEVRSASGGAGGGIYFGGGPQADGKDLALRYFRAVDQGVRAALGADQAPLVLAGVSWLLPMYRQANRHPRLLANDLPVDTAAMDRIERHRMAWEAAAPCYAQRLQQTVERHAAARGTARRAEILSDILGCAVAGRCESLLVASDQERWGTYADEALSAGEHFERRPGDEDLINVAAVLALRTGCEVYALPMADIPGLDPASALLRY